MSSSFWCELIYIFAINTVLIVGHTGAQPPDPLAITEKMNISPPIVDPPIHECALTVEVSAFAPKAVVSVFANGSEPIGKDVLKHPPGKIKLTRALKLGEKITATQTVGSVSSDPSYDPVPVTDYPNLTKPVVVPDIYECGRVVPVANLVASTHVEVSDFTPSPPSLLGTGETTGEWDAIVTSPLVAGHQITAQQIACPNIPTKTVRSPVSAPPLSVKSAPNPPPTLSIDSYIPGTEQLVVRNLLVGAQIQLNYGNTSIPDGLANAAANAVDVPPAPRPPTLITATQTLCSSSLPSAPAVAMNKPTTPILGSPICPGSHYVMVDRTTPGLHVVLLRNGSSIGHVGGTLGTLKLPVGGGGVVLEAGDVLTVVQGLESSFGTFLSDPSNAVTVGCSGGANVITQHNDNHRTGAYTSENILTPGAVLARGMCVKWYQPIDGSVNAQPLYVRQVELPHGFANGLFVAAFWSNKVYALNADTGDLEWSITLEDRNTKIRGFPMGIDSTPVIDVSAHRMYVVFATKNQQFDTADLPDSTQPLPADWDKHHDKPPIYQDTDLKNLDIAFWVVALDYRNGNELARTLISASTYRANGDTVSFEAPFHRQHAALLLDHGTLYVAFGSNAGPESFLAYHGWVMAYRAHDLSFQASFNTSKNYAPSRSPYKVQIDAFGIWHVDAAGIWQAGGGLTADRDGNVFFLAGNGKADVAQDNYGDTFVKLFPTGSSLIPSAFIPSNATKMERNDADFGSGGALTIPGTDLVIGGGKPGYVDLLEASTMGLRQEFIASTNKYDPSKRDDTWNQGPHLHGSPTYWRGPHDKFGNLYIWGEKDYLRRYRFDTVKGSFETQSDDAPDKITALQDTMPGGMISLSSNGNRSGTGVLWATLPTSNIAPHPGRLYAFNAETLQWLWDGPFASMGHWAEPTIADGKVFVGTESKVVICYELCPEGARHNSSGTPYQPRSISMSMKQARLAPSDESPMTTRPINTLLALAPPPDALEYATLNGEGTIAFAARESAERKLDWATRDTSVEASVIKASQPVPENQKLKLTISSDNAWQASDGSGAKTVVLKSYAAPEKDGPSWELYEVRYSSGSGILENVKYIQRVMTRGGLSPATSPKYDGDTARAAFEAQYILYKNDGTSQKNEEARHSEHR